MKKIKNFVFPVVIALIGTGAALATNISQDSDAVLEKGYRYDTVTKKCIVTTVNCSHLPNPTCTWTDGSPLYRFNPSQQTMCGIQLNQP
ncbi:MAG: DUF6520 family protein [Moheibacter sp.]